VILRARTYRTTLWDYATVPPTVQEVRGDRWMPVSPERVQRCQSCGDWSVIDEAGEEVCPECATLTRGDE
jgi:hypothetical protein